MIGARGRGQAGQEEHAALVQQASHLADGEGRLHGQLGEGLQDVEGVVDLLVAGVRCRLELVLFATFFGLFLQAGIRVLIFHL